MLVMQTCMLRIIRVSSATDMRFTEAERRVMEADERHRFSHSRDGALNSHIPTISEQPTVPCFKPLCSCSPILIFFILRAHINLDT
jgi:hypothetical protein